MSEPLYVYDTKHKWSVVIAPAFAQGAASQGVSVKVVPPYPLMPGQVAMYGCLRGMLPTLKQAMAEKRTWYYIDNGYFKRGHFAGYYRVTKNALQHDGTGDHATTRWDRLGLKISPWRTGGKHIVVCPPSNMWGALWGFDNEKWLTDTLAILKKHTDRPIRLRNKVTWAQVKAVGGSPIQEDLRDAHAVVTHSSNSAVDSLLYGVPVFCTSPCAAQRMGKVDLTQNESPVYPEDRLQWAANLAANQWTLEEMRAGLCWKGLNAT